MSLLPILFLNVEQGPKAGCRLECNTATICTVGRARSNTLQIGKDAGISQNHLLFQWTGARDKDGDAHLGWTATDTGSSNGTFINGVLVEPHKAIPLDTGDLIKIGSATTIKVEILGAAHEVIASPKANKSSKRTAACIASESHGKGTSFVSRRHARKRGCIACKALSVQDCEGKEQDGVNGEVCSNKRPMHGMLKGRCKQKLGTEAALSHGKQHCTIATGHDEQQDETAEAKLSWDKDIEGTGGHGKESGNIPAMRRHRRGKLKNDNQAEEGQGKLETNNEAEEDEGKQGCGTRAQDKQAVNNVAKRKRGNNTKALMGNERIVASCAVDINLGMTVEQWFHHMMEEGPKYLYKVSESIIKDVKLESEQFDEYVLSQR